MKFLNQLFDFYIDASIHVALAVLALLGATAVLFSLQIQNHLVLFVFFGSISAYNFVKYGVEAEKYILVATRYHKNIQFFSIIASAVALYHAFFLNKAALLFVGAMVFMTSLYAIPVLPQAKNLRNLGGLKIFVVALVWAGTTVLLPVITNNALISWNILIETVQRFVLVLILLVPFEIRDLAYDNPALKTIPQRFGVSNTRIYGSLGVGVFFALTFLKDDLGVIEIISKGVLFLTLGLVMLLTKRNQEKYYAAFWVEAIPIFWWGILVLLAVYF